MRLLSRIPMVYSSKIFDERIAGKLQFKVSARTRKPENQKTRNQNQNQKDQIRNLQVNFEGSKLDVFRKFLQI
jgi:hypothetical protein